MVSSEVTGLTQLREVARDSIKVSIAWLVITFTHALVVLDVGTGGEGTCAWYVGEAVVEVCGGCGCEAVLTCILWKQ